MNEILEYKSIPLELSELNKEHKTVVFAHATFDNIDKVDDVCRKGMFKRTWNNNKEDVQFRLDHKKGKQPGMVAELFEDDKHAYTKGKFGNHTLGSDTLEMVDQGIIKFSSFGFKPVVASKIDFKGKKVRELKEVYHGESSLLYELDPVNPLSGVKLLNKGSEPVIIELKTRIKQLEIFCRNTTASDECILQIQEEIKALDTFLSSIDDTADTHDGDPAASASNNVILTRIKLLTARL